MAITVKKTLISIDLGNKQVKLESRATGVKVAPSVLLDTRYAPDFYLGGKPENTPSIYRLRLDKEEKSFHFGETINSWGKAYAGHWETSIGFGMKRYTKQIFKELFLFSVARVVKEMNTNHPVLDIVTGLPTGDYKDPKVIDYIRKIAKGFHTIYVDDKPVNFDIASITFYPQYLGSIANNCFQWNGEKYHHLTQNLSKFSGIRYGFMDIGGGTILSDVVEGLNFNLSETKTTSRNGVHRLLGQVAKEASISQVEAELALWHTNEQGRYIIGEKTAAPKDITDIVLRAKKAYTEVVLHEIETQFFQIDLDDRLSSVRLNKIFITGGGAYLIDVDQLIEGIENSYNIPEEFTASGDFIELLNNSTTANVEGYFKLGVAAHLGEFVE
ncbi:ParM/StbA family protein [Lactococcus allomyrinae]|nr:ParM/StbA family protein [Lactococcus allomyrinae]